MERATGEGFEGHPVKKEKEKKRVTKVGKMEFTFQRAFFKNTGKEFDEVELIYLKSGESWGTLAAGGPPLVAKTYKGHEWGIKREIVKTWVIEVMEAEHTYEF
jgi:hypothetical protein